MVYGVTSRMVYIVFFLNGPNVLNNTNRSQMVVSGFTSVTHEMLLRAWGEFNYRRDVYRAAMGGGGGI